METHEAMRLAVGGHAVKVAKALGLSSSLVHKWCEPHTDFSDSGALNPIDRIEAIINTSLREGQAHRDAFAPLYCLAFRFKGLFLPPVQHTLDTCKISQQLCRVMKEAGEAIATAAKALEDDKLSPNERRKIVHTAHDAIAAWSEFVRMVEKQ